MDKKQVIFYVLIFLFFFIFARLSVFISASMKFNIDIILIISAILFTGIVFVAKKMMLDKKDNFFFELTPEKHCLGGSYMWSSDPEKKKFCSQFTPQQMQEYECGTGFHGGVVKWERTDMSDADWQNPMCSQGFGYEYPKPL